ncbi:hypothetical protein VV869_01705 [Photobacterium sp. MCCC 1A19761]|uniref:hypothetical protein n=1 Tax=Photobacterium sp. MCCC 1A19761 TaxID=3115000 RepID=UPI00307E6BA1
MLIFSTAASLSLLPFSAGTGQGIDVYLSTNAMAYAENNSAYQIIKGKEGTYHGSESAFTFNEAALGTRFNQVSFSLISRYDWFLGFSKDTMELYGTTVNGTLIQPDKRYDLYLKTNHIKSDGFRLGYQYDFRQSIKFYGAASYLKAKELMVGETSGWASLTGNCGDDFECYSGEVNLSYTYTEDKLFDRVTDAPQSEYGYSFDVGADWQISKHWLASVYVQDVFSEILWHESPFTDAKATTATSQIEDGKIKINPVITGHEGNRDFKQKLPIKYNALIGYSFDGHATYMRGFRAYDTTLLQFGYQYQSGAAQYRVKVYPELWALGLEYQGSMFNVAVTSDSFDYQKSALLEIKLGLSIPIY